MCVPVCEGRETRASLNEDDIRKSDAAYSKPFPPLHAKWLGGPIRRYCEGVVDISFNLEVRLDCVIPDSYATDAVAQVRMKSGRTRSISMCRFKRYDTSKLAQRFDVEAWLAPREKQLLLGGRPHTLSVERDPVEVLRMGIPFDTCLSLTDGFNADFTGFVPEAGTR